MPISTHTGRPVRPYDRDPYWFYMRDLGLVVQRGLTEYALFDKGAGCDPTRISDEDMALVLDWLAGYDVWHCRGTFRDAVYAAREVCCAA